MNTLCTNDPSYRSAQNKANGISVKVSVTGTILKEVAHAVMYHDKAKLYHARKGRSDGKI